MKKCNVTRRHIISKFIRGPFIESFPICVKEYDTDDGRGDLTIIPPSSRDGKGGVVATQQGMANVRTASVQFDERTRVCLEGEESDELLVDYVLVPCTRRELLG